MLNTGTSGIALPPTNATESLISTADDVVRARVQSVSTQSKSSQLMLAAFWPFPISAWPSKESMSVDMLTYLMRSGGLQLRYESAQRILQLSLREKDPAKQLELMNGTIFLSLSLSLSLSHTHTHTQSQHRNTQRITKPLHRHKTHPSVT